MLDELKEVRAEATVLASRVRKFKAEVDEIMEDDQDMLDMCAALLDPSCPIPHLFERICYCWPIPHDRYASESVTSSTSGFDTYPENVAQQLKLCFYLWYSNFSNHIGPSSGCTVYNVQSGVCRYAAQMRFSTAAALGRAIAPVDAWFKP